MFRNIGIGQAAIVLLVVVLLFGAKKIPELAKSLGKASKEFKNASDTENKTEKSEVDKSETTDASEEKKQS
jgi:sec-independent protein translocase protein TatA